MLKEISQLESLIINVLKEHYPLSPKEILQKVVILYNKKYSPQGVQKALTSLLKKRILHKHSKYYQLQTNTLIDTKQEIEKTLNRYTKAGNYHNFLKKETHYYFETLSELDFFWNATIEKWFSFYPEKKYSYWQLQPYPWFAMLQMHEERRVIANICTKCTEFITVCSDNPATRILQPIYTEYPNSKIYFTNEIQNHGHAFAVYGDHVIETHHPEQTSQLMEELCISQAMNVPISAIIQLAKPGSFKLSIYKDREKAEKYRNSIKKLTHKQF